MKAWVKDNLVLLGPLVLAGIAFSWIQFSGTYLVGTDPFYHIKVAQILSESGSPQTFPWTEFSMLNEGYADKEYLFHLGLIPFLGDSFEGPKAYVVILATLCIFVFLLILKQEKVPGLFFWLLLLFSTGPFFLYRLSVVRPQIVGVTFCLLIFYAAIKKNRWLLFGFCVLYQLSYCASHMAIIVVSVYLILEYLELKKFDYKFMLYCLGGLALGLIIHPNFPNILNLWYVQNIKVLTYKLTQPPGLNLAAELGAPKADVFIKECLALYTLLTGSILVALLGGVKVSRSTGFAFIMAVMFLVLTLLSKRFAEYSIPFLCLFASLLANDIFKQKAFEKAVPSKWIRGSSFLLMGILILFFCGKSIYATREEVKAAGAASLKNAAIWLANNSNNKDRVFTTDWDDFPELFYYNSKNYYLVALDPTFMLEHDPKIFKLWHEVRSGTRKDVYRQVKEVFKCRFLLVDSKSQELLKIAKSDSRLEEKFAGARCTIFELSPSGQE